MARPKSLCLWNMCFCVRAILIILHHTIVPVTVPLFFMHKHAETCVPRDVGIMLTDAGSVLLVIVERSSEDLERTPHTTISSFPVISLQLTVKNINKYISLQSAMCWELKT